MSTSPNPHDIFAQIKQALTVDQHRLRRRLQAVLKKPEHAAALAQWQQDLEKSCQQVASRRLSIPAIRYDDSLPIAERRDEIKLRWKSIRC